MNITFEITTQSINVLVASGTMGAEHNFYFTNRRAQAILNITGGMFAVII